MSVEAQAPPQDPAQLAAEGKARYVSGDFTGAAEHYRQAAEAERDPMLRLKYNGGLADSYYDLGKYAQALSLYQDISRELDPNHPFQSKLRARIAQVKAEIRASQRRQEVPSPGRRRSMPAEPRRYTPQSPPREHPRPRRNRGGREHLISRRRFLQGAGVALLGYLGLRGWEWAQKEREPFSGAVVITAGHHPDPSKGDVGFDRPDYGEWGREANLNRAIATRAAEIVKLHGVTVIEEPQNLAIPQDLQDPNHELHGERELLTTLGWRDNIDRPIALAVDVHVNSGKNNSGIQAWHYDQKAQTSDLDPSLSKDKAGELESRSRAFSERLSASCAEATGLRNQGIFSERDNRHGRLGILHHTNGEDKHNKPAAVSLIECGSIDSADDRALLLSPDGRERFARGIAIACLNAMGVPLQPDVIKESYQPA